MKSIKSIIPKIANRLRLKNDSIEKDAFGLWSEAVRKVPIRSIKEKTQPVSFKYKVLTIKCVDPSLRNELQLHEREIKSSINTEKGKELIQKIRFIS